MVRRHALRVTRDAPSSKSHARLGYAQISLVQLMTCVFRKCVHYERVTADEALKIAQAVAHANKLRFSTHAFERMEERIATHADVREAVRTADVPHPLTTVRTDGFSPAAATSMVAAFALLSRSMMKNE